MPPYGRLTGLQSVDAAQEVVLVAAEQPFADRHKNA